MFNFSTRISGTGSAHPKKSLNNEEISTLVETNDNWIVERTGIKERRISSPGQENEFNSSLAHLAALEALKTANVNPSDVDGIIVATSSPDMIVPSTACLVQSKLGSDRAWAFDLNAACSGFLYAFTVADQMIKSGFSRKILVIGSEVLSPFVNYKDRGSCIIFGDGAGAFLLEAVQSDSESKIISSTMRSDGKNWDIFKIPAGGSRVETTPEAYSNSLNKITMKGQDLFKFAVKLMAEFADQELKKNNLTVNDLSWVVPHQANLRIIEAAMRKIDFPMEKVIVNVDKYGNTSAASVPVAFHEGVKSGKIKRGNLVLLDVFGAGLTYGTTLIRF